MGHWSSFEKERIFNLVKDLHLPEKGIALDFGCGRGIFTSVIQQALPGWEIYGCDISAPAIEYAKEHFKGITFFVLGDEKYKNLKADFLHSHHVIEHTFDLTVTAREMTEFLKERAVMLHSLPCGHAGSLEHRLASMASEGIQLSTGTYFFEDPAHLRRLSAMQLDGYFMEYCFNRKKSYYANQYYGAIYWLSNSSLSQVLQITDSQKANDEYAAQKMRKWRFVLLFTWMCFFATSGFSKLDRGKYYFLKRLLRIAATLLLFPVSLPVRAYINHKAKHEWVKQSGSENGSDMFLVYQRP
jgi:SAM-dependent methyltransferase